MATPYLHTHLTITETHLEKPNLFPPFNYKTLLQSRWRFNHLCMDSRTVAAAGADESESGAKVEVFVPKVLTTPTTYVAPVQIRASPSFDDDEIEFDSESDDDVEYEVRALVVNVNGRKEFSGSSSFRVLSSLGSITSSGEEEEEEFGFLSGEEEFVAALERPYVADEEDVDVAFVELVESLRPIAKLSEDDDNVDVECVRER